MILLNHKILQYMIILIILVDCIHRYLFIYSAIRYKNYSAFINLLIKVAYKIYTEVRYNITNIYQYYYYLYIYIYIYHRITRNKTIINKKKTIKKNKKINNKIYICAQRHTGNEYPECCGYIYKKYISEKRIESRTCSKGKSR